MGGSKYGRGIGHSMPASSGHKAYLGRPFRRHRYPYFFCAPSFRRHIRRHDISLQVLLFSLSPFLFPFPHFSWSLRPIRLTSGRIIAQEIDVQLDVDSSDDDSEGGDAVRREGGM